MDMENKLAEVITKILEGINQDQSLKNLEKQLKRSKNFNKRLVATAYSWIYDKLLSNTVKMQNLSNKSIRVLNESEIHSLGNENYERIQKLYNIGLLTNEDVDLLMNEILILHPNDSISEYEMNLLLLSSLFDIDRYTPPGSRTLLYTSDKIN